MVVKYGRHTKRLSFNDGFSGADALPEGVRALAESTVDQTREAYDRSADAFEASVATSRNPSTLPAKAPPRSTARSSTSRGI